MSLRDKVRSGLLWSTLNLAGARLINFAVVTVLARMLGPEAFGLVSMTLVLQGLTQSIASFGLANALVQQPDVNDAQASSLFWLTVGSAALFGAALFLGAPLAAVFFKDPAITNLVRMAAGTLVVDSVGRVPFALLNKAIKLREIARIDLTAMLGGGACALVAAGLGWGVWSLMLQGALTALLSSGLALRAASFRVRFERPANVGWAFRYGINMIAATLSSQIAYGADRLLIGRYIGSAAVGLYTRAWSLADVVSSSVVDISTRVLFPTLSSLQSKEDSRRLVERALSALGFVLIPASVGVVCVAEPAITVLYGEQWLPAAPLLKALAISLLLLRLSAPLTTIFMARGRTDLMLLWSASAGAVVAGTVFVAARYGDTRTVAMAHAGVSLALFVPRLFAAGYLIGLPAHRALGLLIGPTLCSAVMAAVVIALRELVLQGQPALVQLLALSTTGGVTYLLLAHTLKLSAFTQLRALARSRAI